MNVQVHYQGVDHSPWVDQFITRRISKLDRYLTQSSTIQVNVKYVNKSYVTTLAIHNPYHDYAFSSEGLNLFESFSTAIDKASRSLGEQKRKIKDRIHKRFFSLKKAEAANSLD